MHRPKDGIVSGCTVTVCVRTQVASCLMSLARLRPTHGSIEFNVSAEDEPINEGSLEVESWHDSVFKLQSHMCRMGARAYQ
jgi:hypothetical protein